MPKVVTKKFDLILTDPPWKQFRGGKKSVRPKSSGLELPYKVQSLEVIKQHLEAKQLECNNQHSLFMWTIDKYLHEAETLCIGLGYKLHARMIWNKVTGIPAAFTIRYGHEYLLWFYRNGLAPIAKGERGKIHSVFTEQVKEHSRKPEISYQIIERLYPQANKLEMYAKRSRLGWTSWGDEVDAKSSSEEG